MITGQCECGQVRFEIDAVREEVTVCHCSQCRRMSGHLWASTHAPYAALRFREDTRLKWYQSSHWAKRGFCRDCGTSLFYRMNDEEGVGIAAGCLDLPTGLKISKHIFVKDKGDYYEITDGAEQIQTY